jgi:hypothetical protein
MSRIAREARRIRKAYERHMADTSWALTWTSASGYSPRACMLPLSTAWDAAQAIVRAENEYLHFEYEPSDIPWDGDCEAPKYILDCSVRDDKGRYLAGIGMVGVDSLDDPYLDVLAGELFAEALAEIDLERDAKNHRIATELEERATYASV